MIAHFWGYETEVRAPKGRENPGQQRHGLLLKKKSSFWKKLTNSEKSSKNSKSAAMKIFILEKTNKFREKLQE